jgi:predicted TIM-barrel fold metal-dependent hydrolase
VGEGDQLGAAFPPELVPRLRDLQPKVLLGSDFPNIPYANAEQLTGLARLDLGDDWLRDVCGHSGVRVFGESESPPGRSTP